MEIKFSPSEVKEIQTVLTEMTKDQILSGPEYTSRMHQLKISKSIDLIPDRWKFIAGTLRESSRLYRISGEDTKDEKMIKRADLLNDLALKIQGGRV